MINFCKYKNALGKPNTGIHAFRFKNIAVIGMGGSIMGSKSIYSFLKNRIKKNFFFLDNFEDNKIRNIKKKK